MHSRALTGGWATLSLIASALACAHAPPAQPLVPPELEAEAKFGLMGLDVSGLWMWVERRSPKGPFFLEGCIGYTPAGFRFEQRPDGTVTGSYGEGGPVNGLPIPGAAVAPVLIGALRGRAIEVSGGGETYRFVFDPESQHLVGGSTRTHGRLARLKFLPTKDCPPIP